MALLNVIAEYIPGQKILVKASGDETAIAQLKAKLTAKSFEQNGSPTSWVRSSFTDSSEFDFWLTQVGGMCKKFGDNSPKLAIPVPPSPQPEIQTAQTVQTTIDPIAALQEEVQQLKKSDAIAQQQLSRLLQELSDLEQQLQRG